MTTVRRLKAVSAALTVTAVFTCSHVWGDSTNKEQTNRRVEGISNPAPAKTEAATDDQTSKFSRGNIFTYRTREGETLFAWKVQPKLETAPARPRDILLMVDTSASQVGLPAAMAQQIVRAVIDAAGEKDRVAVWTANLPGASRNLTREFRTPKAKKDGKDVLTKEVEAALQALKDEVPLGLTDLQAALPKAIDSFDQKEGRQRVLVFLGDGMSIPPLDEKERLRLAEKMVGKEIAFYSVPLGPRFDWKNLHGLASATGGLAVRVLPTDRLETLTERLQKAVAEPIFYPSEFRFSEAVTEFYPTKLPPLRGDATTLVVGRLKPGREVTYTAEGAMAGEKAHVKAAEAIPNAEIDNFFLVGMVDQWKKSGTPSAPATLRADRALPLAFQAAQWARDDLKAQGDLALEQNHLEDAGKLFEAAWKLDPDDAEADAGRKVVEKLRQGTITREQIQRSLVKPSDTVLQITKRDKNRTGNDRLGRDNVTVKRAPLKELLAQAEPKPGPRPEVAPPADRGTLERQQGLRQAVEAQRVTDMVDDTLRQARRILPSDPDEAKERLKNIYADVRDNPDLPEKTKQTLLSRLETALRNVETEGVRIKRDRDERLRLLADAERRGRLETERMSANDKLRARMLSFENLMNEARFVEAYQEAQALREEAAARGLPVPPAATVVYDMSLNASHLRALEDLKRRREEGYLLAMMQVERSHVPFPDEPPVVFPPAKVWQELTKMRKTKYESSGIGSDDASPRTFQLRDKLNTPVTLEKGIEKNTPLRDALEFLSDRHDLTIIIDGKAFEGIGVQNVEETQVQLTRLAGVSLGTVLRLLLGQIKGEQGYTGTYLIRRDYVEITTSLNAAAEKTVRAYPVADLVFPIPNSFNPLALNQNLNVLGQTTNIGTMGGLGGLLGVLGGLSGLGLGGLGGLGGGGLGGLGGGLGGLQGNLGLGGGGQFQGGGGFGGGQMQNQGFGGGFSGFGGGQLGQFGNLGGQFGLQGGDQSSILVALITQVVAPGEWGRIIPANRAPGIENLPPGAEQEDPLAVQRELLNQIGYYPPARALIIRGSSRIHTKVGGGALTRPGAPPPPMGALGPNREGAVVIAPGRKRDTDGRVAARTPPRQAPANAVARQPANRQPAAALTDADAKKIWQDALARGIKDPGLIIATADALVALEKFEHAAEFLKANLRLGIVVKPWVYESLALALQLSNGSPVDVERAQVSAIDLEPQDAQGYLRAAEAVAGYGHHDRALALCKQAASLEPNLADAYADALVYADRGKSANAMAWAASNLLEREWATDNNSLHQKAETTLDNLVAALQRESRNADAERLHSTAGRSKERDLVIQLLWQGDADLDLKVKEPIGTKCSALQRYTPGGGILLGDMVAENFNESYVAAQAFSGEYEITVERVWGRPQGSKATLVIIQHQGTPEQSEERLTVVFDRDFTTKISLTNGRRASLASVPAAPFRRPQARPELAGSVNVREKLRALAEGNSDGDADTGMRGGLTGVVAPPDLQRNAGTSKGAGQLAYQTKVPSVVANGADLSAQAIVSSDRRELRLSLSPVSQTVNRLQSGPVVTNPFIPGGN